MVTSVTVLENVGDWLPVSMVQHSRRCEFSAALLWEPQISHSMLCHCSSVLFPTLGSGFSRSRLGSYRLRMFVVQGPTARMCTVRFFSWGADDNVNGWYSLVFRVGQATRTHCPDLYSKLIGFLNSKSVTSEWTFKLYSLLVYYTYQNLKKVTHCAYQPKDCLPRLRFVMFFLGLFRHMTC